MKDYRYLDGLGRLVNRTNTEASAWSASPGAPVLDKVECSWWRVKEEPEYSRDDRNLLWELGIES